jgi:hypothetical protein
VTFGNACALSDGGRYGNRNLFRVRPSGDFEGIEDIEMMSKFIPRTRFQGVQAIQ